MSPLFDTHSHIQFDAFDEDRDAVISRAIEAGVGRIVVCGDDIPSTASAFELAARHPGIILPTAGVHPHEAADTDEGVLAEIESYAKHETCVAIGEIGLDFYREISPREDQHRVLERQLEMALRRGLPVIVHSRGAEDVVAAPLGEYARQATTLKGRGRPVGVMHCFGGTLEQALVFTEMGFLVSLACTVTYPKNDEARRIAAEVPLDCLVAETDSPFLPPQGRRGERNEPAFVVAAVSEIAGAKGITVENAASAMTANAGRLFGISTTQAAVPA